MAEYQSRKIKGWRSVLDDAITEVRERFWNAPSHTVYIAGAEAPRADNLMDHAQWFKRVFGPERQAASAELKQLRKRKQQARYAERTPEQRETKRVRDHERYLLRRSKQSPEERREQCAKVRARRATRTEAEREHERARSRQIRAGKSSEWRAKEAEKKRRRILAKLELYKEIGRRSKLRTRDASNARKRARYAEQKAVHASARQCR